jgi:septum formation protein
LAADTTVGPADRILGKPANLGEAVDMLTALSGRPHQVLTSVAVQHGEQTWQITQCSEVIFSALSTQTIAAYCATPEPYDKAGAYGIQGIAASFIQHIAGSYTGIMGLPLFETAQLLQQAGLRIL